MHAKLGDAVWGVPVDIIRDNDAVEDTEPLAKDLADVISHAGGQSSLGDSVTLAIPKPHPGVDVWLNGSKPNAEYVMAASALAAALFEAGLSKHADPAPFPGGTLSLQKMPALGSTTISVAIGTVPAK
jgi:hypothetical protein